MFETIKRNFTNQSEPVSLGSLETVLTTKFVAINEAVGRKLVAEPEFIEHAKSGGFDFHSFSIFDKDMNKTSIIFNTSSAAPNVGRGLFVVIKGECKGELKPFGVSSLLHELERAIESNASAEELAKIEEAFNWAQLDAA